MRISRLVTLLLPLAVAACDAGPVEVSHPFYLWHLEDPSSVYLFRCVEPASGCAVDGLPGPGVTAGGANRRYIVLQTDHGYYYFARTPYEKSGWGNHPEDIVGPLNVNEFKAAAERLHLPAFSTYP